MEKRSSSDCWMNGRVLLLLFFFFVLRDAALNPLRDNPIINCPKLAPHPKPKKISELYPDNVDAILAMGDSITAAFGLEGIEGGIDEYRGQSWSIGNDDGATTLFNFFQYYNPNVKGGSVSNHFPEICLGVNFCPPDQYRPSYDLLNGAQSGAWVQNLDVQIDYLISEMPALGIDVNNTWKVLTIFIGANNLCKACDDRYSVYDSAVEFKKSLQHILLRVKDNFPKTFVNLVSIFNISGVFEISLSSDYCSGVHDILGFAECECAFSWTDGDYYRQKMDLIAVEYRKAMANAAAEIPQTDTFAIVYQPMFTDLAIPGLEFLSTLDCFHPSLLAHQQLAIGLWDTMLLPKHQKPTNGTFPVPITCPNQATLLYTT
jgi:phospholipase B1